MQKLSLVKLILLLGIGFVPVCGTSVNAQDGAATETPKAEAPKEKTAEQKEKDLAMTIELYSTIMAKTFEKAEVEPEQMEKIKSVIDECIPKLLMSRNHLDGMLTTEQKQKKAAAKRQAIKAKYSQEEAEEFALRKLNLSPEALKAYKDAQAAVESKNNSMNDRIKALLTDEQKKRLPMFAEKPAPAKKQQRKMTVKPAGSDAKAGSGGK